MQFNNVSIRMVDCCAFDVIIVLFAGSFASYVIHVQSQFLKHFIRGRFLGYGEETGLVTTIEVVGIASLIVLFSELWMGESMVIPKSREDGC